MDLQRNGKLALVILASLASPPREPSHPMSSPPALDPCTCKSVAQAGPAWHPKLGLLTSGDGDIVRRALDGTVSVYRKGVGSNGLMFDRRGRLVICEAANRRVTRIEDDGRLTVLADRYDGHRFNQPNDLTLDSRGRIYFSDPRYGDRRGMEMVDADGREVEGVYRIDPDGLVSRVITHEVDRPTAWSSRPTTGRSLSPTTTMTRRRARKLSRFALRPDGTVDPRAGRSYTTGVPRAAPTASSSMPPAACSSPPDGTGRIRPTRCRRSPRRASMSSLPRVNSSR